MFGLKSKSKALLGLDVGSSAVKLVELRRKGDGVVASVADLKELMPETVVDGAIVDSLTLANTISSVLRGRGHEKAAPPTTGEPQNRTSEAQRVLGTAELRGE